VISVNLPVSEMHKCYFPVRMILSVSPVPLHVDSVLPITYLADLCSDLVPKITCQVGSRLISRYGFEHPASTLPTRFPAALDIGYGPACGLANASALVYVAA